MEADLQMREVVFYPSQGLAILENVARNVSGGGEEKFFFLHLLKSGARLTASESIKLRRPVSPSGIPAVFAAIAVILGGPAPRCSEVLYRKLKEKMRSGTFLEVGETYAVLRRIMQHRAPYGKEATMYAKANTLLVEEIAYVKRIDASAAEQLLSEIRPVVTGNSLDVTA